MTTKIKKFTDFRDSMTRELTHFIQSQARALSLSDLDWLVMNLPSLRKRLTKPPLRTYPYLADQLEFLCRFVEEQVVERSRHLAEDAVAEAAFALLYFQRSTDLIPDPIPDMGLLDDAIIVGLVLHRQRHAFKQSSYADMMLRWPEPRLEVEELLSVISPLRLSSFCSSWANRPIA
jgi:uncharacterized membrane protein YkvA (DUF1232 family)